MNRRGSDPAEPGLSSGRVHDARSKSYGRGFSGNVRGGKAAQRI